ncbi:MAG: PEGA domain-containing protein [Deltaproteobacteria bacterium]|nr:PEGA domain-containing protein [Deltaproteobacteria bacterium]
MRPIGACGPLVLVALASSPVPAVAQRSEAIAREHFERGVRLLDDLRYADAAGELEESIEAQESPPALFNLGLAYRGMGRYRKAIAAFGRFLEVATRRHAQMRANATSIVGELTGALAHVHVGVRGGATQVVMDEESIATGDGQYEVEADPGRHVVRASREGYQPARREVEVDPGGSARLVLDVSAHPLPGHLVVDSGTPEAEIRLDGRLVGHGRFAADLTPGHHDLELAASGHGTVRRRIEVRPGSHDRLALRLVVVERPRTILERWWFWAGAAALTAGAVVGAILLWPPENEPYYDGSLDFIVEALELQ